MDEVNNIPASPTLPSGHFCCCFLGHCLCFVVFSVLLWFIISHNNCLLCACRNVDLDYLQIKHVCYSNTQNLKHWLKDYNRKTSFQGLLRIFCHFKWNVETLLLIIPFTLPVFILQLCYIRWIRSTYAESDLHVLNQMYTRWIRSTGDESDLHTLNQIRLLFSPNVRLSIITSIHVGTTLICQWHEELLCRTG